jgi:N-carbamoylputrescine amidase
MVGQAIANGLFIVAVNRIGTEDLNGQVKSPITFYGSSFICDPYGRILVQVRHLRL